MQTMQASYGRAGVNRPAAAATAAADRGKVTTAEPSPAPPQDRANDDEIDRGHHPSKEDPRQCSQSRGDLERPREGLEMDATRSSRRGRGGSGVRRGGRGEGASSRARRDREKDERRDREDNQSSLESLRQPSWPEEDACVKPTRSSRRRPEI